MPELGLFKIVRPSVNILPLEFVLDDFLLRLVGLLVLTTNIECDIQHFLSFFVDIVNVLPQSLSVSLHVVAAPAETVKRTSKNETPPSR